VTTAAVKVKPEMFYQSFSLWSKVGKDDYRLFH